MEALILLRRLLRWRVPRKGPRSQRRLPLRLQPMLLPPTTPWSRSPMAWMCRLVRDAEAAPRASSGGRTLAPGIYKSAPGSYGITLGDLTLDAQGDANAFWVFQMATTLTVGTPTVHRSVLLVNGAQAKNVFWQVGTAATINGILGGGTMQGTIISQAGISVSTAGVAAVTTINGRALCLSGPVTIVNTVINVPAP